MLSYWYYEINALMTMNYELNGYKGTSNYQAHKSSYWNSGDYYQLRMSHYEINRYFTDIFNGYVQATIENWNSEIDMYMIIFQIGFSVVSMVII